MESRPPLTRMTHPLPFEKLGPADFERLCLWLVRREGSEDAQHYGAKGSDQGRDVVAWRGGRRVVFQCKRVERFEPAEAEKELAKLLELPVEAQPQDVVFVVTATVTAETRDRAIAAWGERGSCTFWAGTELDERVKRHRDILEEFFALPGAEPPQVPPQPPEALLKIWLDRVFRAHRQLMPYFERRGAPLLEHVYVELQLSPQHRRRPAEAQLEDLVRERLLGRPMSIRQVLDLDPEEHPWVTRRWLLKGDPGSGKTTLLRHLARTLADAGGEPWVPVFESLPRLLRDEGWLFDRIEQDLDRAGHPSADIRQALENRAEEGGLVLLLDGLDEVPRKLRAAAEELLGDLALKWPRSPIVVATRPIGAGDLGPEYREVEVLPFDDERRRCFLAQWFGGEGRPDVERAAAVAGTFEADRSLRELASNPLYLTLIALLVEEGTEPARHRPRLFDQIFDLLEEGRHHKPPTPIDNREAAHEGLCRLAYQMTEENQDTAAVQALERRLLNDKELREPLQVTWPHLRRYLDDVAEKSGILGPHDGPEADWRFWHRTFREALTAESLAQVYDSGGQAALCGRAEKIEGDLSRWAEPYALVAGRVPEPDRLVLALVDANRDLGLRAIATAQALRPDTLRHVLELSDDWRARTGVYLRVPELIDDPHRALALVDQLRQTTRNGNDVFFLERAAVAVGKKWPEAQRVAEQLVGRLYDHIPPPPKDIFRWITTPLDGCVELWREIPAGEFLMGSPKDPKDETFWKSSQHEVRIGSPFWMAAVPVTVEQYAAFDPKHRSFHHGKVPNEDLRSYPVENITWFQAFAFCQWLSASLPWARGARLPTDEEWEYACRAGSVTRYWSGNNESDLARVGWYGEVGTGHTQRVGEKPANPWGLYDVHGNVCEWTLSEPAGYSESRVDVEPSAVDLAVAAESGASRVIRGGCYWNECRDARSAYWNYIDPRSVFGYQGFRVCLPAAPEPADPKPR